MVFIGQLGQVSDISRSLVLSLTCRDRPVDVLRLNETVKLGSGPYLEAIFDVAGAADVYHGLLLYGAPVSNITHWAFSTTGN